MPRKKHRDSNMIVREFVCGNRYKDAQIAMQRVPPNLLPKVLILVSKDPVGRTMCSTIKRSTSASSSSASLGAIARSLKATASMPVAVVLLKLRALFSDLVGCDSC